MNAVYFSTHKDRDQCPLLSFIRLYGDLKNIIDMSSVMVSMIITVKNYC